MSSRINAAMIAAFALLSAVAVAGWTRQPGAPALLFQYSRQPLPPPRIIARNRRIRTQPTRRMRPTMRRALTHTIEPRVVRSNTVRSNYVERNREVVVQRRGRSTGKSAAIVAGSAGAGAAIGAVAGGGKGAGIGALSGGAAGFIYDRLTHNR